MMSYETAHTINSISGCPNEKTEYMAAQNEDMSWWNPLWLWYSVVERRIVPTVSMLLCLIAHSRERSLSNLERTGTLPSHINVFSVKVSFTLQLLQIIVWSQALIDRSIDRSIAHISPSAVANLPNQCLKASLAVTCSLIISCVNLVPPDSTGISTYKREQIGAKRQ